jgi:hypothetical protein
MKSRGLHEITDRLFPGLTGYFGLNQLTVECSIDPHGHRNCFIINLITYFYV